MINRLFPLSHSMFFLTLRFGPDLDFIAGPESVTQENLTSLHLRRKSFIY